MQKNKRIVLTPSSAKLPIARNIPSSRTRISLNEKKFSPVVIKLSSSAVAKKETPSRQALAFSPQQLLLQSTISTCLDEVRKIDHVNVQLENELKQAKLQVAELTAKLEARHALDEENVASHALNLKLQAKILLYERDGPNSIEQQKYLELEHKYSVLETYYQELLAYVEGQHPQ